MAKAHHHLSFSAPFLVGFLLVLFVSDLAYVHSSCYPQGSVELEPGFDCTYAYCSYIICHNYQVETGIKYDSVACGYNPETGNKVCICCIDG
ncbi:hypothetical protein MKX01_031142 [Papaver californicum]|nr:hypothetical protein MKX01_031142 [Papaver californicum]